MCKCTDELVNIHKVDRLDGGGSPLCDEASCHNFNGLLLFSVEALVRIKSTIFLSVR